MSKQILRTMVGERMCPHRVFLCRLVIAMPSSSELQNGVALGTEKTRYVSSSSDELSMRRLLVGDSEILSESIGKKSAIPGSSRIL